MPTSHRCGALLRNGQPCGRSVAGGSEFCVHHTRLLEVVDAESLRTGRIPKKRALKEPALRVVVDEIETEPKTSATTIEADPSTVRPSLALAAAENLDALKDSFASGGSVSDEAGLDHRGMRRMWRALTRRSTHARCSRSRRRNRAPSPRRSRTPGDGRREPFCASAIDRRRCARHGLGRHAGPFRSDLR
jgi:hypothetical protein